MCGAEDCPKCYPGNFRRIGNRLVNVSELTEEQVDNLEDELVNPSW
jgi:hypothetical protein